MKLAALATLLILITFGAIFISRYGKISVSEDLKNISVSKVLPQATPFIFQELTIPYLRDREYQSSLGELSKYDDKPSYTSHLTSYVSDGLKVNGMLTIPKDDEPPGGHPAIVFVHGYIAPSVYETTTRYNDYVDYLARNGFVVFKIDLRGHGDSEGEATGAYYSSDYVIDTLNAYSALQNADFVNPKKVGLWGHSMAGNVTFRSFVVKSDIPALVIWAGAGYTYSDLLEYRLMDTSYRAPQRTADLARRRQLLRDTYGEFDPHHAFWKQVAPTNYLQGVKGSILLNHAIDDGVVSIEYTRNLNKVLDATNIFHKVNEYPTGGHNLTGTSFTQAMQETVKFFKERL